MPVELVLDVFILRVAKSVQRRKFPCTLSFRGGEYLGREESVSWRVYLGREESVPEGRGVSRERRESERSLKESGFDKIGFEPVLRFLNLE